MGAPGELSPQEPPTEGTCLAPVACEMGRGWSWAVVGAQDLRSGVGRPLRLSSDKRAAKVRGQITWLRGGFGEGEESQRWHGRECPRTFQGAAEGADSVRSWRSSDEVGRDLEGGQGGLPGGGSGTMMVRPG